jgi:exopolysaccharide production protein ExoF
MGRRIAATFALLCATLAAGIAWAADEYTLGPQDKVRIAVVEWFPGTGDLRSPITGEFAVTPTGTVSLPLIGDVKAAGITPSQLANAISDRLQGKLGLEGRPDTSVEVVQFRPFYVAGTVERPGEFLYRPGMTVLQAISLAGGLQRHPAANLLQLERDAALAEDETAALASRIDELQAREARLTAEFNEAKVIEFPADLRGRRTNPSVALLLRLEEVQFEINRRLFNSGVEAQKMQLTMLGQELQSIDQRMLSLSKEQEAVDQHLGMMRRMEARGTATVGRTLDLMRSISEIAGKQRELDVQSLRIQQERARLNEAIARASDQRRNEISGNLQDVKTKLVEFRQRLDSGRKLISLAESVKRSWGAAAQPVYTVIRETKGNVESMVDVSEDTPLKPGDVLKVEQGGGTLQDKTPVSGGDAEPVRPPARGSQARGRAT